MKRITISVLTVALCACLATSVMAQEQQGRGQGRGRGGQGFGGPGGGGFGGGNLLANEQVQKELKITDDQKSKITAIGEESREEMRKVFGGNFQNLTQEERQKAFGEAQKKGQEFAKKMEAVLTPDQTKRYKEIRLNVRGIAALTDEEVSKELKLSEEQVAQLKTIQEEANKQRRELTPDFRRGQQPSQEEIQKNREKREQLDKDTTDESLAILSADQRSQYEKMKGEKFVLERRGFGFGQPGGGQGGQRRRGNDSAGDKKA